MSDAYEHHFIQVNGIRLHVVQAGPIDGPVALLLHGFPEFWRGWASQIDALAAAGYRVWVPDQRGYGESDKPVGIDAYGLETLVDDICALIRSTGASRIPTSCCPRSRPCRNCPASTATSTPKAACSTWARRAT
jgi:pimeloyl-ACP methyl ester carboxylesterase